MRLKDYVKQAGGTIGEQFLIPPDLIEVEPGFNARFDTPELADHIREIANGIKADGFDPTQPLTIKFREDRIYVRDGHCRLAAINLAISEGAEVRRVPCLPMPGGSNEVDDAYLVLTTQTKKLLAPLEYAHQIRKLTRAGQTEKEITERLGCTLDKVRRALELLEAEPEIREAVQAREISATEAVNTVRRHGKEAGTVVKAAVAHARAAGRQTAKPRDVEAVTKPRTEPVSLCSLATAAVRAWREGTPDQCAAAMEALEKHLGPLARIAA